MTRPRSERRSTRPAIVLAVVLLLLLLLLPVLYVLSIGPAALMVTSGVIGLAAYEGFYDPLDWLAMRSDWFDYAINSYIEAWSGPNHWGG